MKISVLDRSTLKNIDLSGLESLGNVEYFEQINPEEIVKKLKDTEVIVTNKVVLDEKILKELTNLKLICLTATGYNNIDIKCANHKGILVCNVTDYSTTSVAQHTFALVLSLIGNIGYYDNFVKSGKYSNSDIFTYLESPFREISNMTWGIVGYGNIGKQVGKIASSLGANIIYYDDMEKNGGNRKVDLNHLLKESDIVSIHCPLNDRTRNLIDMAALKSMKKHSIIANVARGGIINEQDLAEALNEKIIGGACLDVFENEPLEKDSPLYDIIDKDKLILSPHIAWGGDKAVEKLVETLIENIRSYKLGEPQNLVNF